MQKNRNDFLVPNAANENNLFHKTRDINNAIQRQNFIRIKSDSDEKKKQKKNANTRHLQAFLCEVSHHERACIPLFICCVLLRHKEECNTVYMEYFNNICPSNG